MIAVAGCQYTNRTKEIDYGEGSASDARFPPMPTWFDGNWLAFFEQSFGPPGP